MGKDATKEGFSETKEGYHAETQRKHKGAEKGRFN